MNTGFRLGEGKMPIAAIMVFVGLGMLLLMVSQMVGAAVVGPLLFDSIGRFGDVISGVVTMTNAERTYVLLFQAFVAGLTFIGGPLLYIKLYERKPLDVLSPQHLKDPLQLLWPVLLVPAFMPLMEVVIAWNKGMDLPESLNGLEERLFTYEKHLEELTRQLTDFSSPGQFLLGVAVIAILPALGEELTFRGVLQPLLRRALGNWHAAIWITAIIFSAIHVQFYGFVPRMLLGVLFGYLYWWSGNLWAPVLAHFTNNGLTVTMLYLHKTGAIDMDPNKAPEVPLVVMLISAGVGAAVLWRYRERYFTGKSEE